ncbi:hypothetical protein Q1695_002701 [Nippostrongylus brasiliensis]|nr:hypothetical protein Q1695_002701 [Nippostrongylus brasiliensis]
MTSLYPDESYCTSQIGRLLFQPKNEWAVVGVVVDVAEVKQIAGAHIDYRIEIKCIPRNSIELDERYFILTSRFRELNRLHAALSKLHKQLYLRGTFPQFAAPRLIGSTDPAVTAERRRSIDEFLAFVFDSEVLRKARVLQEWVEKATERPNIGQAATPSSFIYEGGNILDAPNVLDQNGDSAEVLVPDAVLPSEDSSPDSSVELSRSASAGEFQFPDVVITAEETDAELLSRRTRKSSVLERLFPKLSPSSQYSSQAMKPTGSGDYLVHAAHLVSTAQRAEHEHAYELAFQCYKSAASSLIQGIQRESDMSRKNAVRRKTAKYLVAAERLYRTHLAYDGAAATINLESLVDSTMSDPDVLAFQCANNCLRNYRVVGVLPNLSAAKWVLKVEEKSTGRPYVMKLLEKGTRTTKSRVLLPTNVPHMVQLHQFFETEILIILVLDYIENGTLWSFLGRYFSESETRFLLSLAAASNSEGNDACPAGEAAPSKLNPNDPYRGRRLHFSVGVDFERVAEMRDETQSNDVPTVSGVCTVGEDVTGASSAPQGDFCVVGDGNDDQLSSHEESPAKVLLPCRDSAADANSDTAHQTLLGCISNVRLYLRRERRKAWPARLRLPEPLIVHWTAQIVSWLYVMHNEHGEVIGDLRPDNLLIDMDGNLQMSYYGKWHYTGRPKEIVEGYSAPECFKYGWVPNMANDVWSLAAIMFELLSGRSLASAAPHGVTKYGELPFPENAEISFAARDLLSQLLTDASSRLTLEAVRAHAFFRTIDWSLYDNPHSVPLNKESSSLASSSLADLRRSRESGESDSGLPLYVPDLLDVAVNEDCE